MSKRKKDLKIELSPAKPFKPRLPSPSEKKMGTKRIEERKQDLDEEHYLDQIEEYWNEKDHIEEVSPFREVGIVLMIDDLKELECDIAARTYDEGVKAIKEYEIDLLLLDHDLGDEDERKTGYGIVSWLEERYHSGEFLWPITIRVTTGNPAGRENIERVLQKYYTRVTTLHDGYFWEIKDQEERQCASESSD